MKGEALLQQSCVNWFNIQYPQFKGLLFAIPNGGSRNIREAANLKRQGVVSGVPDLCLALPNKDYHGFYIELKWGKNLLTVNQVAIIVKLQNQGYKVDVIYSLDEFMTNIIKYIS